jgi:tRNA(Ile)-lysidine synthase
MHSPVGANAFVSQTRPYPDWRIHEAVQMRYALDPQDELLLHLVGNCFGANPPKAIGVAVSGGSDSTALLHLMHQWAGGAGVTLHAVTIDHGLRDAAADEAKSVAQMCAGLGIDHSTLHWTGWDGKGNLQDQARRARYGLMAGWARERGIETVALGHTVEDQAETFLMRLARGSGVDGLSGMATRRRSDGVTWVRPVLLQRRQDLRDYLQRHDVSWIDDPTNEDERFDRVKIRKAMQVLADLGLDAERLAGTAQDLRIARSALELQTQEAAERTVTIKNGDVVLDRMQYRRLPLEISDRLMTHALCWVSSAKYRPRRAALSDVGYAILKGKGTTLHGCLITANKDEIRITREHQAVKDTVCPTDEIWDNRWRLTGPHDNGLELRALGAAGLAECPEWRATGIPRTSLLASPAVWKKDSLVAAPLAGLGNGWRTKALFGLDHFNSSIISH